VPFLALFAVGHWYVGLTSLLHPYLAARTAEAAAPAPASAPADEPAVVA
jgi:hypothetical protein